MATTIYDVAKRAGVSTATVSKVLSDTPYVSEKTRARVRAAVAELEYVPSLAARGLSNARTYILGLTFPYVADYLFGDPHLMAFMSGVERAAGERDYSILLMPAGRADDTASGLRRLLRTQYVDGAIVVGIRSAQPVSEELRKRTYPTVALGYLSPLGEQNTIHADDRQGGFLAAQHLLELGHRRIALIGGPDEITAASERLAGYRAALEAAGLARDPAVTVAGDFTQEGGYAAAGQLLDRHPAPTAIFAVNDRMALGAMACAQQRGLSVPGDLSLVGFDDIPAANLANPPLTTVRQPSLEMGRQATLRLIDLVETGRAGFDPLILPVVLVQRGSTAAPGPDRTGATSEGGS